MKTRFAPSPTGYLHVGNIRTALVAWLFAKSCGGEYILRIDDTDVERSKEEFVDAIKEDLNWLGITYSRVEYQSKRLARYEEVKNKLIEMGRLYPCYESQEELAIKKKIQLSRNMPPIYDRSSLKLSESEKAAFEAKGIKPHWRFKIDEEDIPLCDILRGTINFKPSNISDPVLIRADGSMTYTIASIADDIDFEITHIVRGEDHLSNSAVHYQIFKALGAEIPKFLHLSLLKSKDKEISKRIGGFDIRSLRDSGIEAMAINSFLSKIGTSDPVVFKNHINDLIAEFDPSKFSKSPVTYDIQELEKINLKLIHHMPFEDVKDRVSVTEDFWNAVKGNISSLIELKVWNDICNGEIEPYSDEFTKLISTLLPEGEIISSTWAEWISNISKITDRKGKELYGPIRMSLTGRSDGPELKVLLPILGKNKVISRLLGN